MNKISFIEPQIIKISQSGKDINNEIDVFAIKPIIGKKIIPYNSEKNSWLINNGYFTKIGIKIKLNKIENNIPVNVFITDTITRLTTSYIIKNFDRDNFEFYGDASTPFILKLTAVFKTTFQGFKKFFILLIIVFMVLLFRKLNKVNYLIYFSIGLILIYGFCWLLIAAYYNYPNAEDLSLVMISKKAGVLNGAIQFLVKYDGRYFTNILHGLSPLAWCGVESYKYITIFSIILTCLVHLFFFRIILPIKSNKIIPFIIACLFIIAHLATIPSIVNELYWMASSFVYLWAWDLFLLWICFAILMFESHNNSKKALYFILSLMTLICSYGINEMIIILNVFVLVCFFIHLLRTNKKKIFDFLPFVFTSAICIYVFLSSPGIKFRMESNGLVRDAAFYKTILIIGIKDNLNILYDWTFSNSIILPLTYIITFLLYKYLVVKIKISKIFWIFLILGLIFLIFTLPFTYYIPMGADKYPARIFNFTNWIYLLIILIIIPFIISQYFKNKFLKRILECKSILSGAFLLVLFGVCFGENNFNKIRHEYSNGEYNKYKAEMNQRYDLILNTKIINNWRTVTINPIFAKATTIFSPPEIAPNRSEPNWNKAYEAYFYLDEIKLENDTIDKKKIIQNYVKAYFYNN